VKGRFIVAGNIPYSLTGKLIPLIVEQWRKPDRVILMLQQEVAERLIAKNKKYSVLSVLSQTSADIRIVRRVPKTSFRPIPKVHSALVLFEPKSGYFIRKNPQFRLFVRAGFAHPRKLLSTNLNAFFTSRTAARETLCRLGFNPQCRAENLTPDQWRTLFFEAQG
jgi:16S rRNA (adenine1518-N6/adenine1519-N6)-dimethyltransferase